MTQEEAARKILEAKSCEGIVQCCDCPARRASLDELNKCHEPGAGYGPYEDRALGPVGQAFFESWLKEHGHPGTRPVPVPDESPKEPELYPIGARVKIIKGSLGGYFGEIVETDNSSVPYRIKTDTGMIVWERVDNIELLDSGDKPAPATPNAPSPPPLAAPRLPSSREGTGTSTRDRTRRCVVSE